MQREDWKKFRPHARRTPVVIAYEEMLVLLQFEIKHAQRNGIDCDDLIKEHARLDQLRALYYSSTRRLIDAVEVATIVRLSMTQTRLHLSTMSHADIADDGRTRLYDPAIIFPKFEDKLGRPIRSHCAARSA